MPRLHLHVPSLNGMSQPASVIPLSPVSRKAPDRPLNSLPEIKDDSSLFYRFLPAHLAEWATQNSGLLYVACSQFFFALMNLTVKYFLSITQISVLTLIAVRMVITSLGCISALYLMGDPNYLLGPPDIRYFLAARGIVGFLGLFGNYQSFKGLSVSDSTAIQFLAPSVTAFLGYLFLKETLSRRELMAGVFCLGGVLLVSRPPFLFGARDGTVVPPDDSGTVYIPGEGEDPDLPTPERMRAVAWAFLTVFSASGACE